MRITSMMDLTSEQRAQLARFCQWIFIITFFIGIPALVLWAVQLILDRFANGASDVVSEFGRDTPLILLAFYSGSLGALVAYISARTVSGIPSDPAVTKMAKLLLGGSVAVAALFFLKSGVLVKFFYPKLPISEDALALTYHPVIIVAFIVGLAGPTIVRRIQSAFAKQSPNKVRRV